MNMFIKPAFAAEDTVAITETVTDSAAIAQPPSEKEAMIMNIGMLVVLGVMFYLLLIRPQQKRFKEHSSMLKQLGKGAKVVTQGGLVGVIDKDVSDHEVQVDLGNGVKVTMMRSYIIGRYEDSIPSGKPANDDSKKKKDKSAK